MNNGFESVGSILYRMGLPRRLTVIYATRFQPFASRVGHDTVIKLSFPYNPALVADLKRLIRQFEPQAVDPSKHILAAGGWLPKYTDPTMKGCAIRQ